MTTKESPMSYLHEHTDGQREQQSRIYFDIEQIINRGSITNTDINEYVGVYLSNRELVDQSKELLAQLEKLLETRMLQEIEELDEHMDFSGEINPIWSMLLFNSWEDEDTVIGRYAISDLIEKIKNSKNIQDAARKKVIEFFSSIPDRIQQGETQPKSHSQEHNPGNDRSHAEEQIATYKKQLEQLFPKNIRDDQNIWYDPEIQKAREKCLFLLAKNGNTDLIEQIQDRVWKGGHEKTVSEEKEISELEEEMVQEKLKFAHIFVQFEFLLSSKDGLSLVDEFIDTLPKDEIPEYIRKKMREIAEKYWQLQEDHEQNTQDMQALFPDVSPSELGMRIYGACTGKKPQDTITCILDTDEPFIVFEFSDEDDYAQFLKSRVGITYDAAPGGTYHRSIDLRFGGLHKIIHAKAICLNTSTDNEEIRRNTLTHERQHFINETLSFPTLETLYYQNPWRIKKYGAYRTEDHASHRRNEAMDSAKDELLAYLRDGTRLQLIETILTKSPLYLHISKDTATSAYLHDIITALSDPRTTYLPRVKLVALLYEVPLERMASFIKKLTSSLQHTPTQQLLRKQDNTFKTFQRTMSHARGQKEKEPTNAHKEKNAHALNTSKHTNETQWYIDQYEDGKFEGKDV